MKEYKIVVDTDRKEAYMCYQRDVGLKFFVTPWQYIESTPTHEEAMVYLRSKNGRYIGTFYKDGTVVALNDILNFVPTNTK